MDHSNLNALRVFDVVARHLNFRLAAEELHVTHGAVAQQIRGLEAALEVRLFIRQPRGLALTEAGAALAQPVAQGLALIESGLRQVRSAITQITISVTPSFAAKWLLPRLAAFQTAVPEVDLQIIGDQSVANFRSDGIDIAVRQGRRPEGEDLHSLKLGPQDLVAVATTGLLARFGADRPLGEYPLIEDSHRPWAQLIAQGKIARTDRILRVNQTTLALDAARSGQGVALVPRIYLDVTGADKDLRILSCVPSDPALGFFVVWPAINEHVPALRAVRDWLAEAFAEGSPLATGTEV